MNTPYKVRTAFFIILVGMITFVLFVPLYHLGNDIFSKQPPLKTYIFGTLETANGDIFQKLKLSYDDVAKNEHNAGIGAAQVTISWQDYEVADNIYDENYMSSVLYNIAIFQHAGQKVDIQLAIHYVPTWVMKIPNAYYLNQYGVIAPQAYGFDDPNYVFNRTVRQKVQDFEKHALQKINAAVGLHSIWDFRLDGGEGGEAYYSPSSDGHGHTNSYWAYDSNAQGISKNLPDGVSATPFPGWKPGQQTYKGKPFTISQVQQWYTWYFDARMNYYNWQIALYRSTGFDNYITIETPGFGTRPVEYATNMQMHLNGGGDPNGTMSRAAVWQNLYPEILNKKNIIAYISSMADAVSYSSNDLCQLGDANVNFNTNPSVQTWGGVRYVSFIARKYGFLISGENPGFGAGANSNYGPVMLHEAAREMASCGLIGMFWAHDERLYTSVDTSTANIITLAEYASVIKQYNPLYMLIYPSTPNK